MSMQYFDEWTHLVFENRLAMSAPSPRSSTGFFLRLKLNANEFLSS